MQSPEGLEYTPFRGLGPKVFPVACLSLAETAIKAESGHFQFRSEPSEILNVKSSNTPKTVDFTIY